MKIVYITSLSHSGSTLLDLMLSGHPKITGLGEVHKLVRPDLRKMLPDALQRLRCGCGEAVGRCPVWSRLSEKVAGRPDLGHAASYREVLAAFYRCHGGDQILSDSSKYLPNLAFLLRHGAEIGVPQDSVAVIHLVRDVRGFVLSQRKRGGDGYLPTLREFGRWYTRNLEIERFLKEQRVPFQRVGYEEISMNTEHTMKRIADFLGVAFDPAMLSPGGAEAHLVIGNPMRKDARKSSGVFYDNRWFVDRKLNLLYDTLPRVGSVNRRMVYGNTLAATGE